MLCRQYVGAIKGGKANGSYYIDVTIITPDFTSFFINTHVTRDNKEKPNHLSPLLQLLLKKKVVGVVKQLGHKTAGSQVYWRSVGPLAGSYGG